MAVLHRALFTWFLLLIFMILVVLRLDEKTSWNWFIVFIPMWIFDCVLLAYVLLKLITHCKQHHQQQQFQSRDRGGSATSGPTAITSANTGTSSSCTSEGIYISTTIARRSGGRFNSGTGVVTVAVNRRLIYLCGILVKVVFQAILCLKLENFQEFSLYYVFVPLWIVLITTMGNEDLWKSEAEGVIKDVAACVRSISVSTKCPSSNTGIFFNITTLEGSDLCVELVAGGFGVVGYGHDKVERRIDEARIYETPYALLNDKSPGFRARFAELLASKIQTLKQNQDARENNSD